MSSEPSVSGTSPPCRPTIDRTFRPRGHWPFGGTTAWCSPMWIHRTPYAISREIRTLRSMWSTRSVRKGYRFSGVAKILRSGNEYWKILEHYKGEGADIRRVRTIVLIDVHTAAPLVSPCYMTGLTEDEVRALWGEWHKKLNQRTVVDLIPPTSF